MSTYSNLLKLKKLRAWVDLSTYCNASCPQCHRTNPEGLDKASWLPLVQWSLEDFKKAFPKNSLINYSQFEFCGTWGDPVMNKDIFKICEYIIHNSDCKIQINTNGGIRDEDWWWELGLLSRLNDKRILVIFDIDGCDNDQHQKYRKNVDLDKVINNLTTFTSTESRADIFTIAFEHNQHSLYDIACLAKTAGAKGMGIVLSNRFHRKNQTEFRFKYNNITEKLKKTTLDMDQWTWITLEDKEQMDELRRLSMVKIK